MAYGIMSDFIHSPVSIKICKRPPTLTTISDPYIRFQPFVRIYKKIPNFPMDIFDPVFDLRCDFVVRRWAERAEQAADLGSEGGLSIMVTEHGCATMRSVAGAWRNNMKQYAV
jgi:hypothetical protein